MTAPRVFLYVQHLLGIGHLVRSNRIAAGLLAAGFDVTLAMGGTAVEGFPGAGINVVKLPVVKAGRDGFSALEDNAGNPVDEVFKTARTNQLLAAFKQTRPDVLIVEAYPFGRRIMRFELLPLLDAARAMARQPLIASSVRDILQAQPKPGRAEETLAVVEKYFDLILVHGDPAFAQLGATFPLAHAITKEIYHTGLVAGPVPSQPDDVFDIIVSAGGGAAGLPLVRAAAEMIAGFAGQFRCCLITGPNLPQQEIEALLARRITGLDVFTFRRDLPDLLKGARLSISQAGYNTVCDILRAGCRALLIPFAAGGETEQSVRATRLAEMGLASVLPEQDITAQALSNAALALLNKPNPPASTLNLDGARQTAELLRTKLAAFRPGQSA